MILLCFVVIPIISGVVLYAVPKLPLRFSVIVVELLLSALFILQFADIIQDGNASIIMGAKNPVLGITLLANRYVVALVGLSIFLFFAAFIYTMHEEFFDNKFVMLFLILQGLLCGVFLTDDLFNIYVLLEVATIVVAILIMYKRDSRSMYDGMVYLLSQVICMLFYLFGIGYLYKAFGVLSIAKIAELMPSVDPKSMTLPFAFIMTAVCLKSAFFPLFSWLPRAHGTPSAPSAISAILSGLYVKNGIYLFFVFLNMFKGVIDYSYFFSVLGALTAFMGIVMALSQTDIKLMLAFSTISQIGLIAIGLSSGNDIATIAALYHIICHALFKSLLFLSAGMIIKQYKTRDVREIHGVIHSMPLTAFATILGILGITGAPLFNASVSKYFMQYGTNGSSTEILLTIVNIGTILLFVKYSQIFCGNANKSQMQAKHKVVVILTLGICCVVGGIFGVDAMETIFNTELTIDSMIYLVKNVVFFVSVAGAYLFYRYILSKTTFLYKLKKVSLNFQQIVMAILAFYISISLTLHV